MVVKFDYVELTNLRISNKSVLFGFYKNGIWLSICLVNNFYEGDLWMYSIRKMVF